jgi:hypothetical protein
VGQGDGGLGHREQMQRLAEALDSGCNENKHTCVRCKLQLPAKPGPPTAWRGVNAALNRKPSLD